MSSRAYAWLRWTDRIERHRRAILVFTAIVSLAAGLLAFTRLRLDMDVVGMLPAGLPAFEDFRFFIEDFGELDELTVLVDGSDAAETRRFADAFVARLAELDTIERVHARIDVAAVEEGILGRRLFSYLPVEAYDRLEQRLTPKGIAEQVRANRAILAAPFDLTAPKRIVDDPLGIRRLAADALPKARMETDARGYFVSPDGRALLLFVEPRRSAFDIEFSERLMAGVRGAEAQARAALGGSQVRAAYTGSYVYALEDAATLESDISRYSVLALGGILAVFFAAYRSLRLLPFVAVPLVVTTLLTFAASVAMFDQMNAASLSFAAILYGLSIDSGIHFYARVLQGGARPAREVVAGALAALGRAHLAASLSTAAVFFLIGLSKFVAVSQLGLLTAVGMLLTTVEFYTLYPALAFVFLGRRSPAVPVLDTPALARAGAAAARYPRVALAVACAVALGAAPYARGVEIDVSLDHLRPEDSDAVRIAEEISARFGSREWSGTVLVHERDLEDALVASETVGQVLATFQSEGMVSEYRDVSTVLPSERVQKTRLDRFADLPREAAVERLRTALAAEGFALAPFRPFLESFSRPRGEDDLVRLGDPVLEPFEPLLSRHVRAREAGYAVATYLQPAPGVPIAKVAGRLRDALPGVDHRFASRALLEDELHGVLRNELALFFAAAIAVNLLLVRLGMGSFRAAAGVFLPTLLVVELLLAAMALAGYALDPVNLIVVPIVLGIGVDDGVYVVAAAHERGGWGAALRHCGRALVVTSATTIAGFGFLAPSRFPALAGLGRLAAVGLSLCLLASITVVPALMTMLSRTDAQAKRWNR